MFRNLFIKQSSRLLAPLSTVLMKTWPRVASWKSHFWHSFISLSLLFLGKGWGIVRHRVPECWVAGATSQQLYKDWFPLTDHSAPLKTDSSWHVSSYASRGLTCFRATSAQCPCECFQKENPVCPGFITDLLLELLRTSSTKLWTCLHLRILEWTSNGHLKAHKSRNRSEFSCFQVPVLELKLSALGVCTKYR